MWDLHGMDVAKLELQSPEFPSLHTLRLAWAARAFAGEGEWGVLSLAGVGHSVTCWFTLTARGSSHVHISCLACFRSSDSSAWKESMGKEQFGVLRLLVSYLIYAEHFPRNCLPPLANTLTSYSCVSEQFANRLVFPGNTLMTYIQIIFTYL